MDPALAFLGKILSAALSLGKAEVGTSVGRANLLFAVIMAFLNYFLADKIFAQSTLDWAADTGVGAIIFHPLLVGLVLTSLMLLASLFLIYKDNAGRKR